MDNNCFSGICSVNEEAVKCNIINLLPSGPLWDEQKTDYITNRNLEGCTSLVHFAVFLGDAFMLSLRYMVYPVIRERDPETAVLSLDVWLAKYGWNYQGLGNYDFSRDGLFIKKIEIVNGKKTLVRSEEDLSRYSLALKSAILKILSRGVNSLEYLNLKSLNVLLRPLSVEVIVSDKEPKVRHIKAAKDFYIILKKPVILSVPVLNCESNTLLPIASLQEHFDIEGLILLIAEKIFHMLLRDILK